MKEIKTDILIVGGGMTGLLTACALSSLNLKILLVDSRSFLKKEKLITDYRTTAIAEGSKYFLEKLDLWKNIKKYAENIKNIKVLDRVGSNKIDFTNQRSFGSLGYVVKNYEIKKNLINFIKKKKNITLKANIQLKNIESLEEHVIASDDNYRIFAKLIVSADGKNSFIRKKMNTPQYTKNYKHSALVVNFSHEKNHNNTAHEIFFKSGPLAILPMQSSQQKSFNTSLIWSNTKEFANNLANSSYSIQKEVISEKVKPFTGKILKLFDSNVFDLSAQINSRFYENRIVYVGDSAHSLHPIAGQGWNLGIRDIQNLLKSLEKSCGLGLDCGSNIICKDYHDLAYYDAYSLYQVTDKLNSIFLNENKAAKILRSIGLSFIDKNIALKNKITNFAMGF